MNSQELRALQEAYSQVYELDENRMASRMEKMPLAPAKVGKATHSIKDLVPSKAPSPKEKAKARKALGLGEAVDLYDIILSHLLDEGYADTQEQAEVIMVNMSEEWRESIVEETLDERNRGEQGMSDREVSRRRNLGGNTRSTVSSDALGDHGSQGAIQKFHNRKGKLRQSIHKSGRNTRGDTGESGGKGRYEANKDHTDGYPSITKRGQGPS
jgi:hypothetical protein